MAGILHPPAYHQAWPNSLKFGTIGYLVGHELTHGIITWGSIFNWSGWYPENTVDNCDARVKCYVDHFNNFNIPEINRTINGELTKSENIADSAGLRHALYSYRSFIKQKNLDDVPHGMRSEQMPGLDMSPEQLINTLLNLCA